MWWHKSHSAVPGIHVADVNDVADVVAGHVVADRHDGLVAKVVGDDLLDAGHFQTEAQCA